MAGQLAEMTKGNDDLTVATWTCAGQGVRLRQRPPSAGFCRGIWRAWSAGWDWWATRCRSKARCSTESRSTGQNTSARSCWSIFGPPGAGLCQRNPQVEEVLQFYHDKGFDIIGHQLGPPVRRTGGLVEKGDPLAGRLRRRQAQPHRQPYYGILAIPTTIWWARTAKWCVERPRRRTPVRNWRSFSARWTRRSSRRSRPSN